MHTQIDRLAGQSYFEWIQQPENKDVATDFNLLMKFSTQFRKNWMDVFPPDHILQGVQSSSDSLVRRYRWRHSNRCLGNSVTDIHMSTVRSSYRKLPTVIDSALRKSRGGIQPGTFNGDVELSIETTTQR